MNGRRITDVFQIDSPTALLSEVLEILHLISPSFQTDSIRRAFNAVNDLYAGQFPGYRACNTGPMTSAMPILRFLPWRD